jgi:hypothetical protein
MPGYTTARNKGGRPRLDPSAATSSPVTVWLRPGEHDRVIAEASREGKTISAFMRDAARLKLR